MAPAATKQQSTLSGWFTTPASSAHSKPGPSASAKKPTVVGKPTPPARSRSDEQNDFELPDPKRRKVIPETSRNDTPEEDDEPRASLRSVSGNGTIIRQPPRTPLSSRTSKYAFSQSPQQENRAPSPLDPEEEQRKEDLHHRFVRKLGRPDSIADIRRRNRILNSDEEDGADEEGDDDAEEEPKPKKGVKAINKGGNKLTPMEKQVIEIKQAHPDTLLVVEVGYKFRFFGEDARTAARELSIVCIPGKMRFDEHVSEAHLNRFASASIPVHRLHVHVRRLVSAGHKVGVVRQLETAALKAVGDNRNTPFTRKLTNLYTKGTYIDDTEGIEDNGSPPPEAPATGFLLCLTEEKVKGYGNDEKVHVGILAVQPATGDIVYDNFDDGFMRSEIETRLLHIAPCELLIVGDLSKATDKVVMHLAGSKTNVFGDKVRVERLNKHKTIAAESHNHISNFYAKKLRDVDENDGGKAAKILDKILGLPEHVVICLSSMITHLTDYGLEHVFNLTKYFQPFSARSHMLLNGNTLNSLEVYQNQTDHTIKGSLFWTLDRTKTKYGSRLLRKWVGRPLLDKAAIEARFAAVEELLASGHGVMVDKLTGILVKTRWDLEKSLLRIYYGKCTRKELLNVLQSLQSIGQEFSHIKDESSTGFESPLLASAVASLPAILPVVMVHLEKINAAAAREDDKYAFFLDAYETEAIEEHKHGIASVEHDLDQLRSEFAQVLGKKQPVDYNTTAGIEYLIEVDNASAAIKKVPATWTKISGTKKLSRFQPPKVSTLVKERDQHKESLAAACDEAYTDFLTSISGDYQVLRDTIQSLATIDCLMSLANVASQPGYTKPSFVNRTRINIQGARHPMIEQLLLDAYVPNDVNLTHEQRALLVTGPNMGGKSSYVRSVALIAIMAQIGSFVPADSAELGILDAVFTRMGAFDNMMKGESTFMVELSETSDILKLATDRSLVVLDELGRGTSTHDGMAIASSVLDWLIREKKCLTLFITHYQALARLQDQFSEGELRNVHMKFEHSGEGDHEEVTFLYEVGEGVSYRSYGLNVARLAGLASGVREVAREKSEMLECEMKTRRVRALGKLLESGGEDDGVLERLVEGIEGL
ncbi:DNA mismatch repair protein msh3 [Cyphellophora attinorum]|uniref:DNA mismatch repair protein MSH3 n=1 Tax=Cyphellophora attinorum TaxID=1664694 RepID=A0A0N1HXV3_9EURO|nr:DNA mismatch repair protein msh3 [Phialophora attinorum]KPI45500.1 DNA mismatch repair protein msh3 [Phialophora attinorum]